MTAFFTDIAGRQFDGSATTVLATVTVNPRRHQGGRKAATVREQTNFQGLKTSIARAFRNATIPQLADLDARRNLQ